MDLFDLNTLRIAAMLLGLAMFLALWRHAWSRARRNEYSQAAMAPFDGDAPPQQTVAAPQHTQGALS